MLIILDNAAAADQVRPLLPGSPGCHVVITGRSTLSSLVAREAASRISLGPLLQDEAVSLLRNTLGPERLDAEITAAGEIARWCGFLPLTLRIAADRAQSRPKVRLADLAAQLAAENNRLDMLSTGEDDSSGVRSVFSWSYQALPVQTARMFRLLSLHPGSHLSIAAASALTAVSRGQAKRLLEAMTSAHLLQEIAPDRYCFHDLIRLYAAEQAEVEETEEERAAATRRLLTWYLHTADVADRLLMPHRRHLQLDSPEPCCRPLTFSGYEQALTWCDAEHANLAAVTRLAAQVSEHGFAWKIPATLWSFFSLRKPWGEWISSCQVGLDSAQRSGDQAGEAQMLMSLGNAYADLDHLDEAASCFGGALALRGQTGDEQGVGSGLINLGNTNFMLGNFEEAAANFTQALQILRSCGDTFREGITLNGLGETNRALNRLDEAIECYRSALVIARGLDDRLNAADTVHNLADVYQQLEQFEEAYQYFRTALGTRQEIGDRRGEASSLDSLGDLCHVMGRWREARQAWGDALAICEDLGDPRAASLRDKIALMAAPPVPQH